MNTNKQTETGVLKVLRDEFMCTVELQDIKYITYKARIRKGNVVSLVMEDDGHELGHMYIHLTPESIAHTGITLTTIVDILVEHGVEKRKRQKRKPQFSYYD